MVTLIGRLESTIKNRSCVTFVDHNGIEYIAEVSYRILCKHSISNEGDKFSIIFDTNKDPIIEKLESKVKLTKDAVEAIKEEISNKVKD